ncbi:hypothetical protein, partial [Mesorhizobium sp. B2-8-3]|uniref:hypothetical protein n=1 Tax=Mesorhizobium sp. B2-8-3 TaxID=2589905 RepID=UPI001127AFFD
MAADAIALAIEACYDAAFEFERWPGALQGLADSLGASSCALRTCEQAHPFAADQRNKVGRVPDSTEHAQFSALWHERIGDAPSPHLERPQLLAKPPVSFTVEDEITTPEERKVLPYYREIARPGHREWWASVGTVVNNRKWCVSLYRDAHIGPFYPSEADHFLRVAPDLSRVISAAEKFGELSVGPSLVTLDRLNCGAVLLDSRGCVKRFNERAAALFGSDLVVRHGRIRAIDQPSDARLQGFLRAAVSVVSVRSKPVVIARQGSPWLIAEVMPMTALGLVEIHREFMTAAARWMMALKLW